MGTCNVCGFKATSELNIKRHMRDKHDILSVSTSPPPKKPKVQGVVILEESEDMEIDQDNTKEHENMEIDTIEKQMSRIMDKKVVAKAKKNEEEERIFKNKRKLKEMKEK